ncbi:hypothetical protein ACFQ3Z_44340 [Streptomyces nogalater]
MAAVAVAGRYDVPARTTGRPPVDSLVGTRVIAVPARPVHGSADGQLPADRSRELLSLRRERRWDVGLALPDTDHAGTIMSVYDSVLGKADRRTFPPPRARGSGSPSSAGSGEEFVSGGAQMVGELRLAGLVRADTAFQPRGHGMLSASPWMSVPSPAAGPSEPDEQPSPPYLRRNST